MFQGYWMTGIDMFQPAVLSTHKVKCELQSGLAAVSSQMPAPGLNYATVQFQCGCVCIGASDRRLYKGCCASLRFFSVNMKLWLTTMSHALGQVNQSVPKLISCLLSTCVSRAHISAVNRWRISLNKWFCSTSAEIDPVTFHH